MSALSDYLENELLDHLLRNSAYSRPATIYLALFTADPGESGNTGEVSGGSYARATITNNNTNFPQVAATGTPTKSNGAIISFPTASADWGTVTHWAIYDDDGSPSGNMLVHGSLGTPRFVKSGDTPKVAAGILSFTFSNATSGGITEYTSRKLLDHVFGGPSYTPPATVYIALATGLSGETLTEWGDTDYSRQAAAFDAASGGVSVSSDLETFASSVDGPTATITHFGLYDDGAAGNLLIVGPVSTSRTCIIGDTVTFPDSAFVATLQ
jgi:hypothetical protein